MKSVFAAFAMSFGLCVTGAPLLAATPAHMAQAEQLLSVNQPEQALGLLEAAHDPLSASPQELFLLGVAAKLSNQYAKAETYFRSALVQVPGAGRIRLELAETLFNQRKLKASRSELEFVLGMNPPEQVRENIDGFIAQVDAALIDPNLGPEGPPKNWNAYITTGLTTDSNVNSGPTTDTVFLNGLPFTLSATAQETRDIAAFLRTGISHQFEPENGVSWRSRATLSFTNYSKEDAYDTSTLSIASGPTFVIGERTQISIPIGFDIQRYNAQGSWYSKNLSISPRLQYAVQDNLQIYLDTSFARKDFKGAASRNLSSVTFNPSLNFQPSEDGNIAFGLNFGKENAALDINTNKVKGLYIGYQHVFRKAGLRASISASFLDTQYEGIQAAYREARHDVSKTISMDVSYNLGKLTKVRGLELQGSVSVQRNESNLAINAYDRSQISLSLTKNF